MDSGYLYLNTALNGLFALWCSLTASRPCNPLTRPADHNSSIRPNCRLPGIDRHQILAGTLHHNGNGRARIELAAGGALDSLFDVGLK
jgi:hypothetical protein